jgi:asparagine N-glycosylation enzyme membrane subunit Stt3
MQTGLFHAHSGMRYLVLLAGAVALVYFLVALARGKGFDRAGRILTVIFTSALDLQLILGVLLLLVTHVYPALWGHVFVMVIAVLSAHVVGVINKRRPEERRSNGLALAGVAVPLLLIVGGILSIGRSLV